MTKKAMIMEILKDGEYDDEAIEGLLNGYMHNTKKRVEEVYNAYCNDSSPCRDARDYAYYLMVW